MGPDALIMSDLGLIMLVRERWPEQAIHLSVQANAVNYAAVKFWQGVGLSRVILSRELSLEEIAEIHQQVPEMELEVFVHGALCIAYSGRCLLSGYMTHRDANQGACTNSCRWKYDPHEAIENEVGDLTPSRAVENWQPGVKKGEQTAAFLLQEEGRPGEYMPAYEDEHGTYIMNSKDLRAGQLLAHHVLGEIVSQQTRIKLVKLAAGRSATCWKPEFASAAGAPWSQSNALGKSFWTFRRHSFSPKGIPSTSAERSRPSIVFTRNLRRSEDNLGGQVAHDLQSVTRGSLVKPVLDSNRVDKLAKQIGCFIAGWQGQNQLASCGCCGFAQAAKLH